MYSIVANCVGFQWDEANRDKNWYLLGRTDANRWLFVAFTIRENYIRVISARDMNQKEAKKYGARK
jgi:uncharacterized DUF497 family protein